MPKKIVIAGGPGTGKTTLINALIEKGYNCLEEISRQVTLNARKQGIEQLFLTEPLLFSKLLLEGRIQQFEAAEKATSEVVFFDRGIPDVLAYMDYIGDSYPEAFIEACKAHQYDAILMLKPWAEIFESDSERYENFEQALTIHKYLEDTYSKYGYEIIDVPFGTIEERTTFVTNYAAAL